MKAKSGEAAQALLQPKMALFTLLQRYVEDLPVIFTKKLRLALYSKLKGHRQHSLSLTLTEYTVATFQKIIWCCQARAKTKVIGAKIFARIMGRLPLRHLGMLMEKCI
jgi:hypothetical protein